MWFLAEWPGFSITAKGENRQWWVKGSFHLGFICCSTPPFTSESFVKQHVTSTYGWKSLSHVQLFATPWTIQFPSLGDLPNPGIEPRSPALQTDSLPAGPQGKPKNTGVGSLSLLQRIFLSQESNRCFLHCRQILTLTGTQYIFIEWVDSGMNSGMKKYSRFQSTDPNSDSPHIISAQCSPPY